MRPYVALTLLFLSGCVMVVLPSWDPDPDSIARVTLGRAQRDAQAQQVVLRRESLEAIATTAARIASDVQAWALKPAAFGGGDGGLGGATFEGLGYPTDGGRYHTPDGTFWLEKNGDAVLVHGANRVFAHGAIARVAGTTWQDLSLSIWSE